ncbi:hypothetical protein B0T14DRAFT_534408 [Immersiella caudata]|uniref:Putative gamma-glutamylcyclotransferase n=1 Tax=Immersiella caudata TaxID=314043 RepID=A0AA39X2R8_9PEZI|nr:hypothetical protein B0T14DRAFT_534408 [Immersiella caudata]
MSTQPRPLFIYGTLRALPLLAWALTGEASQVDTISRLIRKATVKGYKRCSAHHADYPAAIKDDEFTIDGEETVEADMYVWDGDRDALSSEPWDMEISIRDRLDDWIDLFEGIELVG